MKNTIEDNLVVWDKEHHWSGDGDEWDGQAKMSGVPYEEWKQSLIDAFLVPNLSPDKDILEIAPGHGRWSEVIAGSCKSLTLIDLSPSCIAFCQERFKGKDHISYRITDGKTLPDVADASIDFVWSFDSFVHMSADVISAYLSEMQRVLKPGGKAIIHHAGRRNSVLWLGFLKNSGKMGRKLYQIVSMGNASDNDGWRSDISRERVAQLVGNAGLSVESQVHEWGENKAYGLPRFGDCITTISKS
jgi:ubiquinone/menaquinone biosynthesis C-methylase UbiE